MLKIKERFNESISYNHTGGRQLSNDTRCIDFS